MGIILSCFMEIVNLQLNILRLGRLVNNIEYYMSLCSNKTYHTTYCNVLNAMINEAKDLVSVKAITYGMEITDEKYLKVMSKINESKDALLAYVEKKFNTSGE